MDESTEQNNCADACFFACLAAGADAVALPRRFGGVDRPGFLKTPGLCEDTRTTVNKKRVSIKDIAELAGVSHPTVSRALRGEGRMSDDTRARILTIAADIGYTPSLI
ncbi:MAG: LacI family DNA-binding transcriptional regulator, partial [Caldilineaceae bacterium]|nr:LacI family DNA-binding transcriptional regulator [Caldilineaceae bacterium]